MNEWYVEKLAHSHNGDASAAVNEQLRADRPQAGLSRLLHVVTPCGYGLASALPLGVSRPMAGAARRR